MGVEKENKGRKGIEHKINEKTKIKEDKQKVRKVDKGAKKDELKKRSEDTNDDDMKTKGIQNFYNKFLNNKARRDSLSDDKNKKRKSNNNMEADTNKKKKNK